MMALNIRTIKRARRALRRQDKPLIKREPGHQGLISSIILMIFEKSAATCRNQSGSRLLAQNPMYHTLQYPLALQTASDQFHRSLIGPSSVCLLWLDGWGRGRYQSPS